MKTAIIILNWNGCAMLRQFLPSVVRYSEVADTTVYVADNGSTDESVAMLCAEFPSVERLLLDKNYGFAQGYNLAIQQVQAEYVVLLNSDVEVTEGWLAPLIGHLEDHPEVVACQPKILSYHQKTHFEYAGASGGYIDKYGYPFCRGRLFGLVEEDRHQYDSIVPIFWATGAALVIRREVFLEVGGLDGRFFAHMEEIDLCWRLRARGKQLVCIPQSVVYHVGGGTLHKESPRKTFLNFRNNLLTLYKNLSDTELKSVMRVRLFLDYVAALVFLLQLKPKNAYAVLSARRAYKQMQPSYAAIRKENLEKRTLHSIPEQIKSGILWQFYAKGRKAYSQLKS